jgi:hypothetical protein
MASQIDELVKMRDMDTLYELMTEDDEWLTQLEAAGGLVKLGDRRGYEFLLTALISDDEEIRGVAEEIFDSPELVKMRDEIEAERQSEHRTRVEAAKKRLQKGGKVFRYKTIYLPSGAIIGDDSLGEGFEVGALEEHGLGGWEVIHMLPSRRALLSNSIDNQFTGAYFLLKKEILPGESAELDEE